MRHPVWIVNSALFFLFFATLCYVLLSGRHDPEIEPIEPKEQKDRPAQPKSSEVNIAKIYERDLFGTYVPKVVEPEKIPESPSTLPEPPPPAIPIIPQKPRPQFLEPLSITLKGIMIISQDDTLNKAIIADNKTKKEQIYKMGDMLEDAHLIKIFRNKVVMLRSNGQQEVLYLRQQDAQLDPTFAMLHGWETVVKPITDNVFLLNANEFILRVNNLAHFIDLLELTTAYQKGNKVGCKIGGIESNSLGAALGLEPGDIILAVNNIPATDSVQRLRIYDQVIKLYENMEDIVVAVLRNNDNLLLTYTFGKPKKKKSEEVAPVVKPHEEIQTAPAEKLTEVIKSEKMEEVKKAKEEKKKKKTDKDKDKEEGEDHDEEGNEDEEGDEGKGNEDHDKEAAIKRKSIDQKLAALKEKTKKTHVRQPQDAIKIAQNKERFDPTLREQRMRERRNMLQKARSPFNTQSPTLLSSRHEKKT